MEVDLPPGVQHQAAGADGADLVVGQGSLGEHVGLPVEAQHLVHLGLVLTFPLPGYKTLHKGLILIDTKIKHYV